MLSARHPPKVRPSLGMRSPHTRILQIALSVPPSVAMAKGSLKPPAQPTSARRSTGPRIAIVVSRYNWTVTGKLLEGAKAAFDVATGGHFPETDVFFAPGAFEVVALSNACAECRAFDGVVALGCIIKGETNHDEVLGHAVTQALANIALVTGTPVSLGVLTVNTADQAKARAGGGGGARGKHGNKGTESMNALLATLSELERIEARRTGGTQRSFEIDLSSLSGAPDKLVRQPANQPSDRGDR